MHFDLASVISIFLYNYQYTDTNRCMEPLNAHIDENFPFKFENLSIKLPFSLNFLYF